MVRPKACAVALAVPICVSAGQRSGSSGSGLGVQIFALVPALTLKPGGNETFTVLLGVSPAAWLRMLVMATGLPGVAGLNLMASFGAKAADADTAGMRAAAHVSSPRRIAARDLITREASMLSSPDNSDLNGGQRRECGGFAGNSEKISP